MAKRFEDSAQDKKGNADLGKRFGLSGDQFDGSSMDDAHDAGGQAGNNRIAARTLAGKGRASEPVARSGNAVPDHAFAHGRPRTDG